MRTIPYQPNEKLIWDRIVASSRNGTFLFYRDFMDYHKDRFEDCSLMFSAKKEIYQGVLPANINQKERIVLSHEGLTYGGLLTTPSCTLAETKEMLKGAADFFMEKGATHLVYKPTPNIYHKYPSEETEYWLFRANAEVIAKTAAQVIDLREPLSFSTLRKRKVKKALSENIIIQQGNIDNLGDFWKILNEVLQEKHATTPVHSLYEIQQLFQRFPDTIKLYLATTPEDKIIAGTILFECPPTLHVQYIAANETAREMGALDLLFHRLINHTPIERFRYFDFGISTENAGRFLNEGLAFQKEGFGGRTICYETYKVDLQKLSIL